MEDIDFNKRLVCDCFPRPEHGSEGYLCFGAASTPPRACACWSGDASRQPEILCKIRRFGFYQRKLPGGASGTSDRKPQPPKPGPPKPGSPPPGPSPGPLMPPPPAPAPAPEASQWRAWLTTPGNVDWRGKDVGIERIITKLEKSEIEIDEIVHELQGGRDNFAGTVLKDCGIDHPGTRLRLLKGLREAKLSCSKDDMQ